MNNPNKKRLRRTMMFLNAHAVPFDVRTRSAS